MKRIGIILALWLAGAVFAAPNDYLSPFAITRDSVSGSLYVAEKTAKQIAKVNPHNGKVLKLYPLPSMPNGMTLSRDGKTLFVTTEEPGGHIYVLNTESGETVKKITAGHTPMSPKLSPDGKTLYVCNRFNNNVSIIDIDSGQTVKILPATREPVALALTKDGRFLYVANHLPTGAANVDFMTSVINVIDTQKKEVIKHISLPNGAIDLREITISPDGKYVYVPSIFARFLVPTTQIERGWINTHALNIIDAHQQKLIYTVLLDDVDLGAANPWGVGCSPDNKYIVVAHSATHEVSIIDREKLFKKLANVPKNDGTHKFEELAENPMNDLSFLFGVRRRVHLKGIGPRNLVVLKDRIYVTEYFSDSLGVVALNPKITDNVRSIPLGPRKKMDPVRLGEMYFNDASLCYQHWQSCATCHPDGRMDAVNWDLLNDGIGNPKSTKSLLLAHKTPPSMIRGVRPDAETSVRAGIQYIQFSMPEEQKASAIDEYLKSLKPVPSPYLVNGKLSKAAERGKKIYEEAGCSICHCGPYYTDMMKHNVGTGADNEEGRAFDTPTLIEVWRTAPYLYDGRAATMKDIFTKFNPNDEHGNTSHLTEEQLNDLIEYVLSL